MLVGTTACGNSSSDKDTAATTTKAETTTTSAEASTTSESESESSSAAAEERAEAANLTLDDLPDGWTSTPNGEENDSNVFDTCGDLDLDEITVAKVSSDNFEYATSDGGGLTLTTTSGVFVRTSDLVTTISGTAIDTEPDGALMNDVVNLVVDRQAD